MPQANAPEQSTSRALTAEDLLAGASATFTVAVPASVLSPSDGGAASAGEVVLRPLSVRDVQRIGQAAKEQKVLASVLMVQQALVKPKLTVEQVGQLPAGVAEFLIEKVNLLSGLSLRGDDLEKAIRAPLARACFVLSREFGWTPAECSALTLGQILLYLEMLANGKTTEVLKP